MDKLKILLTVFILGITGIANACDPCALYSALSSNHGSKGSFYLSAFEQYTTFEKGNSEDYYSIKNGERIKSYSTTQFNLSYGLTDHFSLQLSVPLITRHLDKIRNYRTDSTTDAGFGDLTLLSQFSDSYALSSDFKLITTVYAGIKLPTGDTGSLGADTESVTKHHSIAGNVGAGRILTFGTGSYDFPIGASWMLVKDRILLPFGTQYTFRTEGKFNYRFEDDLYWYVNPGYFVLLEDDYSLSLHLLLSGENKGADERNDQRVPLSSFSNLFLGPSIGFAMDNKLSLEFAVQTRVSEKDNSIIVPENRIRLALNYKF